MGDREEYFSNLYCANFRDDDRRSTMKQCNGCAMTFGTFAELWDHKKVDCKNLGSNGLQSRESTSSQTAYQPSCNDLFISDQDAVAFPDDEREGTYGYCVSYCLIPHGTWLKLDWLEEDPVEKRYKMCLSTRDNEKYPVWVAPRILLGLQRYRELLERESFWGKNIFFKYYGKKTIKHDIQIHDFRLIIN